MSRFVASSCFKSCFRWWSSSRLNFSKFCGLCTTPQLPPSAGPTPNNPSKQSSNLVRPRYLTFLGLGMSSSSRIPAQCCTQSSVITTRLGLFLSSSCCTSTKLPEPNPHLPHITTNYNRKHGRIKLHEITNIYQHIPSFLSAQSSPGFTRILPGRGRAAAERGPGPGPSSYLNGNCRAVPRCSKGSNGSLLILLPINISEVIFSYHLACMSMSIYVQSNNITECTHYNVVYRHIKLCIYNSYIHMHVFL